MTKKDIVAFVPFAVLGIIAIASEWMYEKASVWQIRLNFWRLNMIWDGN